MQGYGVPLTRPLAVFLLALLALAPGGPASAFSAHPTKPIEELLDSNDRYQAFDIVAGYDLEGSPDTMTSTSGRRPVADNALCAANVRYWPKAEWQYPGDRKRKRTFDGQSQSA